MEQEIILQEVPETKVVQEVLGETEKLILAMDSEKKGPTKALEEYIQARSSPGIRFEPLSSRGKPLKSVGMISGLFQNDHEYQIFQN